METQNALFKQFEQVMQLFGCSVMDRAMPDELKIDDWKAILTLAKQQGVWGMLTCILKSKERCPVEIVSAIRQSVIAAAVTFLKRQSDNLGILAEMEAAGLHPVVMKGMAVARYYAMPEVRLSADMDVLIPDTELPQAIDLLCANGYKGEAFHKGMYHVAYTHSLRGMIELHVDLYDDFMREVWFDGVGKKDIIQEEFLMVEAEESEYRTLGATDQLVFLALHMAKHFIAGGISLRMMMDMVVFTRANRLDIDRERFWSVIKKARLDGLMTAVFSIAVKYWEFSKEELLDFVDCRDEMSESLIWDLLEGGSDGHLQGEERRNGWYLLHKEKIMKGRGDTGYSVILFGHTMKRFIGYLFPNKRYLAERYPCLQKRPVLLPFVWLYWIVVRGGNRLIHWKDAAYYVEGDGETETARQRMELFKKMKMI